jgi:hypothetical protein
VALDLHGLDDPAMRVDPHPTLKALRESSPLPALADGLLVIGGHQHFDQVLRDPPPDRDTGAPP